MKLGWVSRFSVLVGLLLVTALAFGDVKSDLTKRYAEIDSYVKARDAAKLEKVTRAWLAESYSYQGKGTPPENKAQYIQRLLQTIHSLTKVKVCHTTLGKITVKDGVASVPNKTHVILTAKNPSTGKPVTIDGTETSVDTWKYTGGVWKMTLTVVSDSKMKQASAAKAATSK
jgi:hypothetical protein